MIQAEMPEVKSMTKEYYDNGNLSCLYKYTETGDSISHERWYKNGIKEYYLGFDIKDATLITDHLEWWPNGNPKIEIHFSKDKTHRIHMSWYKDGKLESEEKYEDGVRVRREYHHNGKLRYQEIGTSSKEWDPDGNPLVEIDSGIKKAYHLNGNLRLLEENDVKRTWYANGKLESEFNFLNGAKHGIQKRYYRSGQLQYEDEYDNGCGIVFKYWYESGQLRFCKNLLEDYYIEYFEDGKVKIDKDGKHYHHNGVLHIEHIKLD